MSACRSPLAGNGSIRYLKVIFRGATSIHHPLYAPSSPPLHILPAPLTARLRTCPRRLRRHPTRHVEILQRIGSARPAAQYALLLLLFELLFHFRIH